MSLGGDIGSQLIAIIEKVKADLIANDFATRSYVDEIISSGIISRIVSELPATGDAGVIYLVPVKQIFQKDHNIYKEYIYVDGAWEDLGSTELNLEDYPTKTYIDEKLATKLTKNDPSIPTKLSDLELDEASKFVDLITVSKLPDVTTAKTNAIYFLTADRVDTVSTGSEKVLTPNDWKGMTFKVTNKGSAAVQMYKTLIGEEEEADKTFVIAINASTGWTIPSNVSQIRFVSLSGNLNLTIQWAYGNELGQTRKYVKHNNAWEELRDIDSVTYDYLRTNYYLKNEIYTKDIISNNIDSLISQLDNAEYDSVINWENAYKATLPAGVFYSILHDDIHYHIYSDDNVYTSNNLAEWNSTFVAGKVYDTTYYRKTGKFYISALGCLYHSDNCTSLGDVAVKFSGNAKVASSYSSIVALVNATETSLSVLSSKNGEDFTTISITHAENEGLYNVLYYDGIQYVAVSTGGYIITSPDGTVWTKPINKLPTKDWVSADYDGRHVVLLSKAGEVCYTKDSNTFTEVTKETALANYSSAWCDICFGTARTLVALSKDGYLGVAKGYLTV